MCKGHFNGTVTPVRPAAPFQLTTACWMNSLWFSKGKPAATARHEQATSSTQDSRIALQLQPHRQSKLI